MKCHPKWVNYLLHKIGEEAIILIKQILGVSQLTLNLLLI